MKTGVSHVTLSGMAMMGWPQACTVESRLRAVWKWEKGVDLGFHDGGGVRPAAFGPNSYNDKMTLLL